MEHDYSERIDSNIKLIQGLRMEVESEVDLYEDRRHQNCDINIEIDKQRKLVSDRQLEI